MADKTPSGSFTPPPAHAPHEVASAAPIIGNRDIAAKQEAASLRAEQRRAAGDQVSVPEGEQELKVYAPPKLTREQQVALIGLEAVERAERAESDARSRSGAPQPSGIQDPAPPALDAPVVTSSFKPVDIPLVKSRSLRHATPRPAVTVAVDKIDSPPDESRYGAPAADWSASDQPPVEVAAAPEPIKETASPAEVPFGVDTPARGLPKAIADPGKKITGGFGDMGEALYYPLDGLEAGKLALALLDDLAARIPDDMRFGMAVVYPRIHIRAVIEVRAYAAETSFSIEKIDASAQQTPMDLARQHGDEIVFCVISERQEMTDDGESVSPPNAIRAEIGLSIPSKRRIETPGGRMFVDVVDEIEVKTP